MLLSIFWNFLCVRQIGCCIWNFLIIHFGMQVQNFIILKIDECNYVKDICKIKRTKCKVEVGTPNTMFLNYPLLSPIKNLFVIERIRNYVHRSKRSASLQYCWFNIWDFYVLPKHLVVNKLFVFQREIFHELLEHEPFFYYSMLTGVRGVHTYIHTHALTHTLVSQLLHILWIWNLCQDFPLLNNENWWRAGSRDWSVIFDTSWRIKIYVINQLLLSRRHLWKVSRSYHVYNLAN